MKNGLLSTCVLMSSLVLAGVVGCEGQSPVEKAGDEISKTATTSMEKAKGVEDTLGQAAERTAAEAEKATE